MTSIYDKISNERKKMQAEGTIPEWWSTGGWQLFKDKYLYQAENPKQQYLRIASTLAAHTPDPNKWKDTFFDLMWKGWLSPATPILSNTGTDRGLPVSCAGSYMGDSIYEIYEGKKEIAMLTKMGFGTASYLGDIRPRGSVISDGGKSMGVMPIIQGMHSDMDYVSQGVSRRGSWAGYLPIDHGDFNEVCTYLEQNPDGNNIGWNISNAFTERLNSGDEEAIGRYAKAMKTKMLTGKGYFWFTDKANDNRPECYKANNLDIKAAQLCNEISLHSSEEYSYTCQPSFATIIKRGEGLVTLEDVDVGDTIWSSEGWTVVKGKVSSGIKPVNEYKTVNGVFVGTEDHRVVQNGCKVEARDAEDIDFCPSPTFSLSSEILPEYVLNGLILGDGTIRNNQIALCVGERDQDYYSSEIKGFIEKDGFSYFRRVCNEDDIFVDVSKKTYERDFDMGLLTNDSEKISFLRGLFTANGSAIKQADNGVQVILTQSSEEVARKVQFMLQSLGFSPKLYKTKGKDVTFSNGTYMCKDRYDLKLCKNKEVKKFKEIIGFMQEYKNAIIDEMPVKIPKQRKCTGNIYEVSPLGDYEVYHIEVSNESHTYWTGGLNVSNCVLASMNLEKFDEWKDTDAVFNSTVFLDSVCQEFIERAKNIKGLEKAVAFTKRSRALGLGVTGFCSYLYKNMIPYESAEAAKFNHKAFKLLKEESTRASQWLAETWGEPEWCKGFGVANSHRIAVAPTKSTALIMGGLSEGINPDTAMVFTQRSAGGEIDRMNIHLLALMKEKGVYSTKNVEEVRDAMGSVQGVDWLTEEEKNVFKTAFEIDQRTVLRYASNRAKHIDQWQSLNLFFAGDDEESYVNEVHRTAFQDPNILGLYYVYSKAGVQASRDECVACQ